MLVAHATPDGLVTRRAFVRAGLAAVFAGIAAGCRTSSAPRPITLPERHRLQEPQLQIVSDFHLADDHELLADLRGLRDEVNGILNLPPARREVVVYLFDDEPHYQRYFEATYPQLPARRAYFIGTSQELAVFTFWGDRVQEDLRHEYTHGLLHSSLSDVPLWLDEGIAEYFEVPRTQQGRLNGDYAERLSLAISEGWKPDLQRLEHLETVSDMLREDYQEAWAWVHFLLHHSPDSYATLVDYLTDLRGVDPPITLSLRLHEMFPDLNARFAGHVATLPMSHRTAAAG